MESVFQAHLLPVGASPGLGRLAVARQMSLGVAETGVALTLLSFLNHRLTKIQDGSRPHRCCRWHCFTNERLTRLPAACQVLWEQIWGWAQRLLEAGLLEEEVES